MLHILSRLSKSGYPLARPFHISSLLHHLQSLKPKTSALNIANKRIRDAREVPETLNRKKDSQLEEEEVDKTIRHS